MQVNNIENPYIGVGLYTIAEASKLTRVSGQRISRWLNGYAYQGKLGNKKMAPLWTSDNEKVRCQNAMTFKDLLEVQFINAFANAGVSMIHIRRAAEIACEEYKQSYPFSTQNFKTDGKKIFVEIAQNSDDRKLVDLIDKQWAFNKIIEPSLKGIEFNAAGIAERWFPPEGNKNKLVVLDPNRSFGKPIVKEEGVPTSILSKAYYVEEDYNYVAKIYDVSLKSVKAAVQFEDFLKT